jgi:hypothetical protein
MNTIKPNAVMTWTKRTFSGTRMPRVLSHRWQVNLHYECSMMTHLTSNLLSFGTLLEDIDIELNNYKKDAAEITRISGVSSLEDVGQM